MNCDITPMNEVVTFVPEGVIVGFQIFAWGFKSQQIRFGVKQELGDPPAPVGVDFLVFFMKKTKSA